MKRATFKKPFNGMDNALKLIPESYKVDGNEFELTDGVETYRVRWDINEATVLRAENKNLISEDMQKIKHLMGFKSQDTLGNLKGEQRIVENKSFGDVWDKTKKLLNEADENDSSLVEQAFGMGFTNEGNLEENEPMAEMQREEEGVDEVVSVSKLKDRQMSDINKDYDIKDPNITEEDDNGDMIQAVENYFKTIQQNSTLMGYLETIQKNPNAQKQAITHFAEVVGVPSNKLSAIVTDIKADAKDTQMEGTLNEDFNIPMDSPTGYNINGLNHVAKEVAPGKWRIFIRTEENPEGVDAYEYFGGGIMWTDYPSEGDAIKAIHQTGDKSLKTRNPDLAEEGEMCAECGDGYMEEEKDRFDEIFEDLYKSEEEGEDFPDLTGDGEVTQADILKGRGVFEGEGYPTDKWSDEDKRKWDETGDYMKDQYKTVMAMNGIPDSYGELNQIYMTMAMNNQI